MKKYVKSHRKVLKSVTYLLNRPVLSGVDFANILRKAFTLTDPKSAKNTAKPSVFLHFWDLLS